MARKLRIHWAARMAAKISRRVPQIAGMAGTSAHRTYLSTRRRPGVLGHFSSARLPAGAGHQDPTEQVQVKDKGNNEYQAPPSSRIAEHVDDYGDPNCREKPDHPR